MTIDSVKKMKDALCEKLKVSFGSTVEEANDAQMMRASALVLRDVMAERSVDTMRFSPCARPARNTAVRCTTCRWNF